MLLCILLLLLLLPAMDKYRKLFFKIYRIPDITIIMIYMHNTLMLILTQNKMNSTSGYYCKMNYLLHVESTKCQFHIR